MSKFKIFIKLTQIELYFISGNKKVSKKGFQICNDVQITKVFGIQCNISIKQLII